MTRILIRIAVFLAGSALLVGGAYWYWTTTPLFAFQEAAAAVHDHDLAKFDRYVDYRKLLDSAINDVLIDPIETMPGISTMGRQIAVAAINISVEPAAANLQRQIERYLNRLSVVPQQQQRKIAARASELYAASIDCMADDEDSPYTLVSYSDSSSSTSDLGKVLAVTRNEMTDESNKLKKMAYERMQSYARNHQEGIVGKVFTMTRNPQQANIGDLLREYGLVPENLRGLAYCNTTDDGIHEGCKTGFKFMSAKVEHNVVVEVELKKHAGNWQIVRLSNLNQLFEELDPSYPHDFQTLIQSSVQGITSPSVNRDLSRMSKRITESDAVKNLLHKFNGGSSGINLP